MEYLLGQLVISMLAISIGLPFPVRCHELNQNTKTNHNVDFCESENKQSISTDNKAPRILWL